MPRFAPYRFLLISPILIALLTACDEEVLGPTLRGTIDGRVLTFDERAPVPGAGITTSPATGAYTTDDSGAFTLSNVNSGTYNISVRKSGFRPTTLSVAVRDDETTPATIYLERDAEATQVDSLTAEIVNWSNREVNSDTTYVDVDYRVRNAGTTDLSTYEVYVRIETTSSSYFREIKGENLPGLRPT